MTNSDEHLLRDIGRRNWYILTALILLSLPWRSLPVTLGVAGGGLVAIGGYLWLHRSLSSILRESAPGAARRFQFGYLFRLGALGAVLALLIAVIKVHPVALAIGLSVVVLNLLWTTLRRSI